MEEQKACILVHGSSHLREKEACILVKMEKNDKTKAETDDSLQGDPDMHDVMHEVELKKCATSVEIDSESLVANAYWADRSSLKLVCGCLHHVWKSEDSQSSRTLLVVSKIRIPKVLNELHNDPSGGHLKITTTLEKVKKQV